MPPYDSVFHLTSDSRYGELKRKPSFLPSMNPYIVKKHCPLYCNETLELQEPTRVRMPVEYVSEHLQLLYETEHKVDLTDCIDLPSNRILCLMLQACLVFKSKEYPVTLCTYALAVSYMRQVLKRNQSPTIAITHALVCVLLAYKIEVDYADEKEMKWTFAYALKYNVFKLQYEKPKDCLVELKHLARIERKVLKTLGYQLQHVTSFECLHYMIEALETDETQHVQISSTANSLMTYLASTPILANSY
jgi:hypothetical protein